MCSDIIFGYSPITQPKASQTKDLLLWELLEARLLFRKDSLGSTEGVPQHKGRILALSELQKWAGRLLQCHWADNSPCSDKRPQPSCSTGQGLREDLSKAGSSKAS